MEMSGPWVNEQDIAIVTDALRNGWYGKNAYKYVELFEAEFASFHSRKYALMTPNCTSALHLILKALGVEEGDEVIAPDITWIGSVAGITYQGAKTVLADVDPESWCLTAQTIAKCITPKTKAVIVVGVYGNMPEFDEIQELCDKKGIFLIEDAAESLGSTFNKTKSGKFGIASTFSFHRTKTMTTGEGGCLLLDDDELFERCKFLRDHGRHPGAWFNEEVTPKYMPSNLQGALAHAQFLRLDELVNKKRWLLHGFKNRLEGIEDIYFNPEPDHIYNGAWAPALVFGKSHKISREMAMVALTEMGLPVRPFFYPLTFLPAFDQEEYGRRHNPVAYDISERGICLPSALNLVDEDLDLYAEGIKNLLKRGS